MPHLVPSHQNHKQIVNGSMGNTRHVQLDTNFVKDVLHDTKTIHTLSQKDTNVIVTSKAVLSRIQSAFWPVGRDHFFFENFVSCQ